MTSAYNPEYDIKFVRVEGRLDGNSLLFSSTYSEKETEEDITTAFMSLYPEAVITKVCSFYRRFDPASEKLRFIDIPLAGE